jgi:hypothetical protein
MTHGIIKEAPKVFKKKFSKHYLRLSQDKVVNVKIYLAKILQNYVDKFSDIPRLEEVEANLQDSGITEIEHIYCNQNKNKQKFSNLPASNDIYYLEFLDETDPTLSLYMTKKLDLENPELLKDKSEDAYLEKKETKNSDNILPKFVTKQKEDVNKIIDEFQEFDDLDLSDLNNILAKD